MWSAERARHPDIDSQPQAIYAFSMMRHRSACHFYWYPPTRTGPGVIGVRS
jgi:hypothetical protein